MSRANEPTCHLSPVIGHESSQTFEGSQHLKMTPAWKHTHTRACRESLLFFLNCAPMQPECGPALRVCVCRHTPPPLIFQLTGRWMLAVTPALVCSCQTRWGHGESTTALINLNHRPAFCRTLPVASNIYLVAPDAKVLTSTESRWPERLSDAAATKTGPL